MAEPPPSRNLFFPLTVFFSGAFVVTILAIVAGIFGDPQAPLAQVLDRHAGKLLGFEVIAILVCGFFALFTDRRQTLAAKAQSTDSVPAVSIHPGGAPHVQSREGGD